MPPSWSWRSSGSWSSASGGRSRIWSRMSSGTWSAGDWGDAGAAVTASSAAGAAARRVAAGRRRRRRCPRRGRRADELPPERARDAGRIAGAAELLLGGRGLGPVRAHRRVVLGQVEVLVDPRLVRAQPGDAVVGLEDVGGRAATLGRDPGRAGLGVAAAGEVAAGAGVDVVEAEVEQVTDLVVLVQRPGLVVDVVEEALEAGVALGVRLAGPRVGAAGVGRRPGRRSRPRAADRRDRGGSRRGSLRSSAPGGLPRRAARSRRGRDAAPARPRSRPRRGRLERRLGGVVERR